MFVLINTKTSELYLYAEDCYRLVNKNGIWSTNPLVILDSLLCSDFELLGDLY